MGKSNKLKRRRITSVAKPDVTPDLPAEVIEEDNLLCGLVLPEELQITIETLQSLSAHPEVLKSRAFKGLKTAVWDFHQRWSDTAGAGTSLTSRISLALTDRRYVDALVLLSEMRLRGQRPKLGALQRWVRECDAASTRDGKIVWEVLEAILRTTEPINPRQSGSCPGAQGEIVRREADWVVRDATGEDLWSELESGRLVTGSDRDSIRACFLPLLTTPGSERRPPNLYSSTIYHSPSDPLALAKAVPTPAERHDHPTVPGLFLLTDVLSQTEARAIVTAAECVGLEPDQPVGGSAAELTSVLAHNMIWLINPEFHDTLYGRIKHLLPPIMDGGTVRGINKRFRIYRYRPGALYRPHVDGAWPASALSETTPPTYVYDSDPALYSRLTLLIYLNDGFQGGCTTFFLPSSDRPSGLDACPVRPIMGSAAVFPHGDTYGSLLHEGSGVLEGAKWVVRTEVLYEVGKAGRGGLDALVT